MLVRHPRQKISLAVIRAFRLGPCRLCILERPLRMCACFHLQRKEINTLTISIAQHARRPEDETDKGDDAKNRKQRYAEIRAENARGLPSHLERAEDDRRRQ